MALKPILKRLLLALISISVILGLASSFKINPPGTTCLAASILVLTFGIYVFCKGPRLPLNRAFLFLSLAFFGFTLLVYLLHIATAISPEKRKPIFLAVTFLRNGLLLGPAAMMYFSYHLIEPRKRWLLQISRIVLLSMMPFVILNICQLYVTEYSIKPGYPWALTPSGNTGAYAIAGIMIILWSVISWVIVLAQSIITDSRIKRGHYLFYLVGCGLALGHAFFGYFCQFKDVLGISYSKNWFPATSGITWAAFPIIMGIAVARLKLFDIKIIIRRTLPYALGTMFIGLLYASVLAGLKTLGTDLGLLSRNGEFITFLLLVGLVFHPVLEALQRGLDRIFFRAEAKLESFITEASDNYRAAKTRDDLGQLLARDATNALSLEGACVVCGETQIENVAWSTDPGSFDSLLGLSLPQQNAENNNLDLSASETQITHGSNDRDLTELLTAAQAVIALPLSEGKTNCWLLCRERKSHESLTTRDKRFLAALTSQAATALSRIEAREDASSLKELNEAIFATMTNAVAVVDSNGCLLNCNPAFISLFPEATGKQISKLGFDLDTLKRSNLPGEIRIGDRDLLVSSRLLPGRENRTILVIMDVTELHRLQEIDRRKEALAEIGATVSSINHEIGNIISPLSHLLTKAISCSEQEESEKCISSALDRVNLMEKLSRELREFYKNPEITPRSTSLANVVESALSDLRSGTSSWSEPDKIGLETNIWADPQKFRQVILNLLKNAHEAINESPGKTWSIHAATANKQVNIQIIDSGSGIQNKNLKRIFEPFYSTKNDRGTGLGLAVVRRIVEAHGAQISVNSQLNVGTTFSLIWPADKSNKS
jgi:signal transduction histidine kinase